MSLHTDFLPLRHLTFIGPTEDIAVANARAAIARYTKVRNLSPIIHKDGHDITIPE